MKINQKFKKIQNFKNKKEEIYIIIELVVSKKTNNNKTNNFKVNYHCHFKKFIKIKNKSRV